MSLKQDHLPPSDVPVHLSMPDSTNAMFQSSHESNQPRQVCDSTGGAFNPLAPRRTMGYGEMALGYYEVYPQLFNDNYYSEYHHDLPLEGHPRLSPKKDQREMMHQPLPPSLIPPRRTASSEVLVLSPQLQMGSAITLVLPLERDSLELTAFKYPVPVKPRIATTYWDDENTMCYQVEARGVLVSRREDNNFINGTKLLNVAGMSRGKRDGILKTERVRNVVRAGAMSLKGVWIPFERAREIARNEGVDNFLFPLFVEDIKDFFVNKGSQLKSTQDYDQFMNQRFLAP